VIACTFLLIKLERCRRRRRMRRRAEAMTGMGGDLYMHADFV